MAALKELMANKKANQDDDKVDMSGLGGGLAVGLNKKLISSTTKEDKRKM
jgi:hypothetical protein